MSRFNGEKYVIDESNIRPKSSRNFIPVQSKQQVMGNIIGDDQDITTSTNFNLPREKYSKNEKRSDYSVTNFDQDFYNSTISDDLYNRGNTRLNNKEYSTTR